METHSFVRILDESCTGGDFSASDASKRTRFSSRSRQFHQVDKVLRSRVLYFILINFLCGLYYTFYGLILMWLVLFILRAEDVAFRFINISYHAGLKSSKFY